MNHPILTSIAGLAVIISPLISVHAADAGATVVNHARPFEPAVKPALLPPRPGAVGPAGWLRDWAQSARHGITGHLDERHPTFADGWKGVPIKAPGAKPDGTGWPIEQSAYWPDDYHLLPYGVASGEEFASGIAAFRKTETCDVTAMLLAASCRICKDRRGGTSSGRAPDQAQSKSQVPSRRCSGSKSQIPTWLLEIWSAKSWHTWRCRLAGSAGSAR
jgi:hypothetical protein